LVSIEIADVPLETVDRLLAIYALPQESPRSAKPNQRSVLAPAKPSSEEHDVSGMPRLRAAIVEALRAAPRTKLEILECLKKQQSHKNVTASHLSWQLQLLRQHNQVRLIKGRKWELV
jgi:hypothetical protein